MAYRTVRFAPLEGDGVGDPRVTRGLIRWSPARREAYGDSGELQPGKPRSLSFAGLALTDDLPVGVPVKVEGFFGDRIDLKNPTWVDYVRLDAGATTVDYEDKTVDASGIVLLDPTTLDLAAPMKSEDKAALDELREDVDAIGAGVPIGGLEANQISDITEPGLTMVTVTGASLAIRQGAARTALGAGTSNLALGTGSGNAAQGDLVVNKAGAETITGIKTFSANPVFNDAAIPQAKVSGLPALAADVATALAAATAAATDAATALAAAATAQAAADDAAATAGLAIDAQELSDALSGYVTDAELQAFAGSQVLFNPYNGVAWQVSRPVTVQPILSYKGPFAPPWQDTAKHDFWVGTPVP